MSRAARQVTQADIARVIRAAKEAGADEGCQRRAHQKRGSLPPVPLILGAGVK